MEIYDPALRFFNDGGLFMYPILILGVTAALIIVERFSVLALMSLRSKRLWKKLLPQLESGQLGLAARTAASSSCETAGLLSRGLKRLETGRRRDDLERVLEEGLIGLLPRIERHTHYLSKFAIVAILMGALGTIVSLIGIFAVADSSAPFAVPGSGMSTAMNPAALGLIVAIPMLLLHALLQTWTTELIDHFEIVSITFVNEVSATRQRQTVPAVRTPLRAVEVARDVVAA